MHKYKIIIQGESGIFTGFFKCSEEFISSELIVKIKKDSTGLLLDKVYYKTGENNKYREYKRRATLFTSSFYSCSFNGIKGEKKGGKYYKASKFKF